jgi:tRNA (cmo5U34)-methyltransferase
VLVVWGASELSCTVYGFDGSREMLQQAQTNLAKYGERFKAERFDLAARSWRAFNWPIHAVVSSLAIHHLNGQQKQELFHDLHQLLADDGVLVIADVIEPVHRVGAELAAKAWDTAVHQHALELNGNTDAFDVFQRELWNMYRYLDPEDIDKPSRLLNQLKWLEQAGFLHVDVYWMKAGHAIFGGHKEAV